MSRACNSGFILASYLNSYHYLWDDADLLLKLARDPRYAKTYWPTQLARSAALLYVMAFEGLMNRALGAFLSKQDREEVLNRERQMSALDKLDELLAKAPMSKGRVDKSCYPWSHLKEVIELRNDYVHPKFGRYSFLELFEGKISVNLLPERIPKGLQCQIEDETSPVTITRNHVVYDQTGLPKDPTRFLPEDAGKVRKIIEDNIRKIDNLLDRAFTHDQWMAKDCFKLIYPPGKTLHDQPPPYPAELRAKFGG